MPAVQAALVEAYRSVGGGGAEAEAKAEADALRDKVAQLEQALLEKDQQLSSMSEKAQHEGSTNSSGGDSDESKDGEVKDSSSSSRRAENKGLVTHDTQRGEGEGDGLSLIEQERAAWVAERAGLAQQMEALRVEVGGTERILAEAADRVAFLEREAASAGTAGFNEGQAEGLAQGIAQAEATAAEQQVGKYRDIAC